LGDTWVRPADSKVMVFVPSGTLQMGSIGGDSDEQPVYTVALDGFWIDRTEVTNAHYRQCVEAGDCTPPAESGSYTRDAYYGESAFNDYPIIWINWYQAAAYCEWAGGRLPTEAEWEYTARGPEERVFPWGDKFDGTRLNYCDVNCGFDHADEMADDGYADTAPVGSYPSGISWCGALDMAGNVWEWTASLYWPYPYQLDDGRNNPDTEGARVMRGGSWDDFQGYAHASHRYNRTPGYSNYYTGFRCVSQ
jgi:formylglycine-generating enzyme required for sulfatase activity